MGKKSKGAKKGEDDNGEDISGEVRAMIKELNIPAMEVVEAPARKEKKNKRAEKKLAQQKDKFAKKANVEKEREAAKVEKKESKKKETKKSGKKQEREEMDYEEGKNGETLDNTPKGKHIEFSDSDASDEEDIAFDHDGLVVEKEMDEDVIPPWYEERLPELDRYSEVSFGKRKRNLDNVGDLRSRGEKLLEQEVEKERIRNDEESQWMKQMMRSGTLSDKIAAMALAVSNNPKGNMPLLDSLLKMTSKKGRREATLAIDAITDLFINNLLPSDRPLRPFNDNVENLTSKGLNGVTEQHLLQWALEGEIKTKFLHFVKSLEAWSFDTLEYMRRTAVTTAYKLLKEKPEQEQLLLSLIVNKLGDTLRKISSHVVFILSELLTTHPNMSIVVAVEVEQFLFRPNVSSRGIYYGTIFLNQIVLVRGESEKLAGKLISIYLRLFKSVIRKDGGISLAALPEEDKVVKGKPKAKKKSSKKAHPNKKKKVVETSEDAVQSRFVSAILTGVNRAFPYANTKGEEFNEYIDALFEMVHIGTFTTATQCLLLLLHIMLSRGVLSDRFYRALYSKLLAPDLRTTSKQTMFLNVLFRAVKHDPENKRVMAFLKRLCQVALLNSAAFATGALVLVSAMCKQRPAMKLLLGSAEELVSLEEEKIAEDKKTNPEDQKSAGSDDDEDDSLPARNDENIKILIEQPEEEESGDQSSEKPAVVPGEVAIAPGLDDHDPAKRDPLHAGCTESTRLWELDLLTKHYHPSVRAFAFALATKKEGIQYAGDPLREFSSNVFFDRFVYRNPRKRDVEQLRSVGVFGSHSRIGKLGKRAVAPSVISSQFLMKDSAKISADERFFHEYFQKRAVNHGGFADFVAKRVEIEAKDKSRDNFLDDGEDEMDEYADKLALDLMEQSYGKADIDDDEDFNFDYSDSDDGEAAKQGESLGDEMFFDENMSSDEDEPVLDGESDEDAVFDDLDDEISDDFSDDADDGEVPDTLVGGDVDDEEDDNEDLKRPKKKRASQLDAFANAEEFAHLLEHAGRDSRSKKQKAWEDKLDNAESAERRRGALKRVRGIVGKHNKGKGRR